MESKTGNYGGYTENNLPTKVDESVSQIYQHLDSPSEAKFNNGVRSHVVSSSSDISCNELRIKNVSTSPLSLMENLSNYSSLTSSNTGMTTLVLDEEKLHSASELLDDLKARQNENTSFHEIFHQSSVTPFDFEEMEVISDTSMSAEQPPVNRSMSEELYTKENSLTTIHRSQKQEGYVPLPFRNKNLNTYSHKVSKIKSTAQNHHDVIDYLNNDHVLSDFEGKNMESYLSEVGNDLEGSTNRASTYRANSHNMNVRKTANASDKHVYFASDYKFLISPSRENILTDSIGYVEGDPRFQKNYFNFEPNNRKMGTSIDYESKGTIPVMDYKETHGVASSKTLNEMDCLEHVILDGENKTDRKYMQFPITNFETIVMNFIIDENSGISNSRNLNGTQGNNSENTGNSSTEERNQNHDSHSTNNFSGTRAEATRGTSNVQNNNNGKNIKFEREISNGAQSKNKGKVGENTKDGRLSSKEKSKAARNGEAGVSNDTYLQIFEDVKGPFKSRVAIIGGKPKEVQAQTLDINKRFAEQISSSEEILGVHTINITSQFKRASSNKKPQHTIKIESDGVTKTFQQGNAKPGIFETINAVSNLVTSRIIEETTEMLKKLSNCKHERTKDKKDTRPDVKENKKVRKSSETKNVEKPQDQQKSAISRIKESLPFVRKKPLEDEIIQPEKKETGTMVDSAQKESKFESCVCDKCSCLNKKACKKVDSKDKSQVTSPGKPQSSTPDIQGSTSKMPEKSDENIQISKQAPTSITNIEEKRKSPSEEILRSKDTSRESYNMMQTPAEVAVKEEIPKSDIAPSTDERGDIKDSTSERHKEKISDRSSIQSSTDKDEKKENDQTEPSNDDYSKIADNTEEEEKSSSQSEVMPRSKDTSREASNITQTREEVAVKEEIPKLDIAPLNAEREVIEEPSSERYKEKTSDRSSVQSSTDKEVKKENGQTEPSKDDTSKISDKERDNTSYSRDTSIPKSSHSKEKKDSLTQHSQSSKTASKYGLDNSVQSRESSQTSSAKKSQRRTSHRTSKPSSADANSRQLKQSQKSSLSSHEGTVYPKALVQGQQSDKISTDENLPTPSENLKAPLTSHSERISSPVAQSKRSSMPFSGKNQSASVVSPSRKSPSESIASSTQENQPESLPYPQTIRPESSSPSSSFQKSPSTESSSRRPSESKAPQTQKSPSGSSTLHSQKGLSGSITSHSQRRSSGSGTSKSQNGESVFETTYAQISPSGSKASHSQKRSSRSQVSHSSKSPRVSKTSYSQKSPSGSEFQKSSPGSEVFHTQQSPSGSEVSHSQISSLKSSTSQFQEKLSEPTTTHSQKNSPVTHSETSSLKSKTSHSQKSSPRFEGSLTEKPPSGSETSPSKKSPPVSVASYSQGSPLGSEASHSKKSLSGSVGSHSQKSRSQSIASRSQKGSSRSVASHSQKSPPGSISSYSQKSPLGSEASHSKKRLSGSVASHSQKSSSGSIVTHSQKSASASATSSVQDPLKSLASPENSASLSTSRKSSIKSTESSESVSLKGSAKQVSKLEKNTSVISNEEYSFKKLNQSEDSHEKISVTTFNSAEQSNYKVMQHSQGIPEDEQIVPVYFSDVRKSYSMYSSPLRRWKENQVEAIDILLDDSQNRVTFYHYQNLKMYSDTLHDMKIMDNNNDLLSMCNIFPLESNSTSENILYDISTIENNTTGDSDEGEEFMGDRKPEEEEEGEDKYEEGKDDIREKEEKVEEKEYGDWEEELANGEEGQGGTEDGIFEKMYMNRSSSHEIGGNQSQINNDYFINNGNPKSAEGYHEKSDLKIINELKRTSAIGCGLGFYKLTSKGLVFVTCDITKHKKDNQNLLPELLSSKIKLTPKQIFKNKGLYLAEATEEIGHIGSDPRECNLEEIYKKGTDIFSKTSCSRITIGSTKKSDIKPQISNTKHEVEYLHIPSTQKSATNLNLHDSQIINKQFCGMQCLESTLKKSKPAEVTSSKRLRKINDKEKLTQIDDKASCEEFPCQHSQICCVSLNHQLPSENIFCNSRELTKINSPRFSNVNIEYKVLFKKTYFGDFQNQSEEEILNTYGNFTENIFVNGNDDSESLLNTGNFTENIFVNGNDDSESLLNTIHTDEVLNLHDTSATETISEDISSLISNVKNKINLKHDCSNEKNGSNDKSEILLALPITDAEIDLQCKSQNKIYTTIENNYADISKDKTRFPQLAIDYRLDSDKFQLMTDHEESIIHSKMFHDSSKFINQKISAYPVMKLRSGKLRDKSKSATKSSELSSEASKSTYNLESKTNTEDSKTLNKKSKIMKHVSMSIKNISFPESSLIVHKQPREAKSKEQSIKFNYESGILTPQKREPTIQESVTTKKKSKIKSMKYFDKCFKIFKRRKKTAKSTTFVPDGELVELLVAPSSTTTILSEKFSDEQIPSDASPTFESSDQGLKAFHRRSTALFDDLRHAVIGFSPEWPEGTPDEIISENRSIGPSIVRPKDITRTLKQGFRYDNLAISGDRCFTMRPVQKRYTKPLVFHGNDPPENIMVRIGFSREVARQLLKDEGFANRLQAAIREAGVWTHKISRNQAGLLVLIAHIAKPKIMRYYPFVVEAITNSRIINSAQLNGFLEMLENIETGTISLQDMFGKDVFEDQDEEKTTVETKIRNIYNELMAMAGEEAAKAGLKRISRRSNRIFQYISSIILLKPILEEHMRLLAHYIGQNQIKSVLQTEAAVIYLSKVDRDVDIEEFEQLCGIKQKN